MDGMIWAYALWVIVRARMENNNALSMFGGFMSHFSFRMRSLVKAPIYRNGVRQWKTIGRGLPGAGLSSPFDLYGDYYKRTK
jgi:hypothetical protein